MTYSIRISGFSPAGPSLAPERSVTVIDSQRNFTVSNADIHGSGVNFNTPYLASQNGYVSGGGQNAGQSQIDKFSFSSNANASIAGNLTTGLTQVVGLSSKTHGYVSGGTPVLIPNRGTDVNTIQKFPFATDANATSVGFNAGSDYSRQVGCYSLSNGYLFGGFRNSPFARWQSGFRFPFANEGNVVSIGPTVLLTERYAATGNQSSVNGYISGGQQVTYNNTIAKFPFANEAPTAFVGNLLSAIAEASGNSSETHGYFVAGAFQSPSFNYRNVIEKFPFATDANSTDVGDLTRTGTGTSGQSSEAAGYVSGGTEIGIPGSPVSVNTIEKFSFVSDQNSIDVSNLTRTSAVDSAGHEV